MTKTAIALVLVLVGCSADVAESYSQIQYLETQCDEDDRINLQYNEVRIVHAAVEYDNWEAGVGWRAAPDGRVEFGLCEDTVQVWYVHR